MANKKINPRLIELANKTCNLDLELPNLEVSNLEKIAKKQTNQLERDENRKPIVKLTALENTAVSTPTQESYDTLLQVYECGGWKWASGSLPTEKDYWKNFKEESCIGAINGFGHKNAYKNTSVFSPQEFYNKQNITNDMIKQINEYFENKK